MQRADYLFTSESVSEGHPDKVCDRISDAIVDAYLAADPGSRVACETLATTNRIVIAGEVRGPAEIDLRAHRAAGARRGPGDRLRAGRLPLADAKVEVHLHAQSADIAMGVDAAGNKDEGAGDQGIMFGYRLPRDRGADAGARSSSPTPSCASMAEARRHGAEPAYLGPDAKSQVTCATRTASRSRATSVVVSTQHAPEVDPGRRPRDRPAVRAGDPARGLDVPRGPISTSTRPAGS